MLTLSVKRDHIFSEDEKWSGLVDYCCPDFSIPFCFLLVSQVSHIFLYFQWEQQAQPPTEKKEYSWLVRLVTCMVNSIALCETN